MRTHPLLHGDYDRGDRPSAASGDADARKNDGGAAHKRDRCS